MPMSAWDYKTQDASIRPMGSMAQDFSAAFGLGEDDKRIPNIDSDGVFVGAIHPLYHLNQEKDRRSLSYTSGSTSGKRSWNAKR